MRREFHVRFCERAAVGFLRATHRCFLIRPSRAKGVVEEWTCPGFVER